VHDEDHDGHQHPADVNGRFTPVTDGNSSRIRRQRIAATAHDRLAARMPRSLRCAIPSGYRGT
jgi:hypothetical protein